MKKNHQRPTDGSTGGQQVTLKLNPQWGRWFIYIRRKFYGTQN